jgi:NhaP-type Na+/H+ and K+/H+ antiporter
MHRLPIEYCVCHINLIVLGGITRTARMDTECEYTFELFMCLALLEECRGDLLQSTDTAAVFTVINK